MAVDPAAVDHESGGSGLWKPEVGAISLMTVALNPLYSREIYSHPEGFTKVGRSPREI